MSTNYLVDMEKKIISVLDELEEIKTGVAELESCWAYPHAGIYVVTVLESIDHVKVGSVTV